MFGWIKKRCNSAYNYIKGAIQAGLNYLKQTIFSQRKPATARPKRSKKLISPPSILQGAYHKIRNFAEGKYNMIPYVFPSHTPAYATLMPAIKDRKFAEVRKMLANNQIVKKAVEKKYPFLPRFNACFEPIAGDGNCQFGAIAFHVYKDETRHADVRAAVISHIKNAENYEEYKNYLLNTDGWPDPDGWLASMSNSTVWGDNVTLKAAAEVFNKRIIVHNLANEGNPQGPLQIYAPANYQANNLTVRPSDIEISHQDIVLLYNGNSHYDTIYLRSTTAQQSRPQLTN